jgi:hypothetical protein
MSTAIRVARTGLVLAVAIIIHMGLFVPEDVLRQLTGAWTWFLAGVAIRALWVPGAR